MNPKGTRINPTTIRGFLAGPEKNSILPTRKRYFVVMRPLSLEIHMIFHTLDVRKDKSGSQAPPPPKTTLAAKGSLAYCPNHVPILFKGEGVPVFVGLGCPLCSQHVCFHFRTKHLLGLVHLLCPTMILAQAASDNQSWPLQGCQSKCRKTSQKKPTTR